MSLLVYWIGHWDKQLSTASRRFDSCQQTSCVHDYKLLDGYALWPLTAAKFAVYTLQIHVHWFCGPLNTVPAFDSSISQ